MNTIGGKIKKFLYADGTPGWRQITAQEELLSILEQNMKIAQKNEEIAQEDVIDSHDCKQESCKVCLDYWGEAR